MIIHQNEKVEIVYNADKRRLTQKWKGFVKTNEFRKAIDKTVEFVSQGKVETLIADTVQQSVVRPEDAEYAASTMPTMFGSGLKRMAFIIPEDVFTKISLQKFADREETKGVQYFDTHDKANSWLDEI